MNKSRRIRWTEGVVSMREKKCAYRICWEIQKERDHYENADVGGRIILNGSWRNRMVWC
jgi:hypothetical protein